MWSHNSQVVTTTQSRITNDDKSIARNRCSQLAVDSNAETIKIFPLKILVSAEYESVTFEN